MMPEESGRKRRLRVALASVMIAIGVLHLVRPASFVKIMPAFLPAPLFLVHLSDRVV
ncbi:MAG TPA: hypothetical protein VM925_14280 [Labilithrix sp.]|jgi:uncharacterized membrane protein|nr:hypothetical protein [Labilithrix sp.]